MTSLAQSQSKILSLPAELILQIGQLIPLNDLKNLRQTCSRANSLLGEFYRSVKFGTIRIAFIEHSVKTLKKLCSRPDLVRYVKRVQIGLEYFSIHTEDKRVWLPEFKDWNSFEGENGYLILAELLSRIPNLKIVEIYNDFGEADATDTWGVPPGLGPAVKRAEGLNSRTRRINPNIYGNVMMILFKGIQRGELKITELTTPNMPIGEVAISFLQLDHLAKEIDDSHRTQVSKLTKFHLQVDGISKPWDYHVYNSASSLDGLLLSVSNNLQELFLKFSNYDYRDVLFSDVPPIEVTFYLSHTYEPKVFLPALESLRLEAVRCPQHRLSSFLDRHRQTLRRLHLQDVAIEGEWFELIRNLKQSLNLDWLRIERELDDPFFPAKDRDFRQGDRIIIPNRNSWEGNTATISSSRSWRKPRMYNFDGLVEALKSGKLLGDYLEETGSREDTEAGSPCLSSSSFDSCIRED